MKPNRSVMTAIMALLLIGAWFWFNSGKEPEKSPLSNTSEQQKIKSLPTVVTQRLTSKPHKITLKLFGRTKVTREVMLKAKTQGTVMAAPIAEGRRVKRGTVVCRQDINARQANVDQARAQLKSREVDFEAARKLVERGFSTESQLLSAQAGLDAAKAGVKRAEIELDNINIRAPFSGIYEKQIAEIGDYLGPGQPCGQLIELNPLTVTIDVTESQLPFITPGGEADIELATGQTVKGKVKVIQSSANPTTRTFEAKIAVPNPDLSLKAGVSATVTLTGGEDMAHLVPSRVVSLNDDGILGAKFLEFGVVQFAPVSTIDESPEGIWVTGLPNTVDLIVQGQDFVAVGIEAEARNVE